MCDIVSDWIINDNRTHTIKEGKNACRGDDDNKHYNKREEVVQ